MGKRERTPEEKALAAAIIFLVTAGVGSVLLVMIVGPLMGAK